MIHQRILLARVKTAKSMVGISSVWEIMKFVPILCMAAALLLGCGEPNLEDPKVREKILAEAINEDSLQTRGAPSGEELRYAPNQEQPYTGWVKRNRSLQHFRNGKPHGLHISWYSNGQNSEKGAMSNGEKVGLWIRWYENGQKRGKETYKDDNRNGRWVYWYENGQKWSEGTYKNGKEDGLWTDWHENGQKMCEVTYKDAGMFLLRKIQVLVPSRG